MMLSTLQLLAALAFAAPASSSPGMPAVLQPLGQTVAAAAAEPPSISVSVQIAGGSARAESAALDVAGRYGGRSDFRSRRGDGPVYLRVAFGQASLSTQRQLLERVVAEIGAAGVGVVSGRTEALVPPLDNRRAAVAQEAEALKAEQASVRGALAQAPRISGLIDEKLAWLAAFSPETEPRRAFLEVVVRLAQEGSPTPEGPRK